MVNYPFELDDVDFSHMVERDSYSTELEPVFSSETVTMDKTIHKRLVRNRGYVTVGLNPQTAADTAALCNALLKCPIMVKYHCLQRHMDVYAQMALDNTLTASYLSRCLYRGEKWNEVKSITLMEL